MNLRLHFSIYHPIVLIFLLTSVTTKSLTTEIYPLATMNPMKKPSEYPLSRYERGLEDYDEEQLRMEQQGRGMMYEDVPMESQKAIKNDPWQGYYDFLINEGSFKFWAVFEIITAAILIYSALAAVYYAKYNFIQADYDYGDYRGRSAPNSASSLGAGLNIQTFQRILNAISSKKYS